ncbi:MAG: hypothetical protein LBJ59_08195, partial [Zoogloeaceae bacterium]|nr:hypothetical protein [Zoogloeaceae bacterium]
LQTKLAGAKDDDEKRATLESMAAIAQGSGIGKIIQDQQAMMALIAMLNNQGYMQDVRRQVLENDVASGGAADSNFALMQETTGYKLRMAGEMKDMAQKSSLDSLTPTIGKAAEAFSELAANHQTLVGAGSLAATSLTALAGAAGLAAMAMGSGAIGKAAVGTAGRAVAGVAALGAPAAAVAGAGAVGYGIGTYVVNPLIDKGVTAMTGKEASLGTWLSDALNKGKDDPLLAPVKLPPSPVDINAGIKVTLDKGLLLQSQTMQASGGTVRMDTGNVRTGAP